MDWVDRVYDIDKDLNLFDSATKELLRKYRQEHIAVMKTCNVTEREARIIRLLPAYMDSDVLSKCVAEVFKCDYEVGEAVVIASNAGNFQQ